jgi:hypothetical protein
MNTLSFGNIGYVEFVKKELSKCYNPVLMAQDELFWIDHHGCVFIITFYIRKLSTKCQNIFYLKGKRCSLILTPAQPFPAEEIMLHCYINFHGKLW